MATVIIQNRRGSYDNFDPQKLKPGEFAIVQENDPNSSDGKAIYIAITSGDLKRLATADEMSDYNDTALSILNSVRELASLVSDLRIQAAQAAGNAENSATDASNSANDASNSANDASNSAEDSATSMVNSESYRLRSEAWAVGQKNGVDVPERDETYENNSKYYAEQASWHLAGASMNAETSVNYATGKTRSGQDVPETHAAYHNNSKYYAEQASQTLINAQTAINTAKLQAIQAINDAADARASTIDTDGIIHL